MEQIPDWTAAGQKDLVLEKVPGAIAFPGVAPKGEEATISAPLPRGMALHCAFATRFLEKGWE